VSQSGRVTVSMKPALLKRVDRAAKTLGYNRSEFVSMALDAFLQDGEDFVKVAADPVVMRAMLGAFNKPGVLSAMGRALGEDLDPKQVQLFLAAADPSKRTRPGNRGAG
jgi:hypothetical protein